MQDKLIEYIQTQLQSGQKSEDIAAKLAKSGWNQTDILSGFRKLGYATFGATPQPKKKKTLLLVALPIVVILFLTVVICVYLYISQISNAGNIRKINNITSHTSRTQITSVSTPTTFVSQVTLSPALTSQLASSEATFGLNTIKQLANNLPTDQNVFISPLSIDLALSMVYNGANGKTKNDMANVLGLSQFNIYQINQYNGSLIQTLNTGGGFALNVANSLWVDQGNTFIPQFLQTTQKYYNAVAKSINFQDPASADTINTWASNKTNGKITHVVDSNTLQQQKLALIDSVYFNAKWKDEFDPKQTTTKPFYLQNGQTEQVQMMTKYTQDSYIETPTFQAVELPYINGNIAMDVFLPKISMRQFISTLSETDLRQYFSQLLQSTGKVQGTIDLPKFTMNYNQDLKDVLSQMGMSIIFDRSLADFTHMLQGNDLYVSSVQHDTYVAVDEQGTEATAITAVIMSVGGGGGPTPSINYLFNANRPFFIIIRTTTTSVPLILYSGVINKP